MALPSEQWLWGKGEGLLGRWKDLRVRRVPVDPTAWPGLVGLPSLSGPVPPQALTLSLSLSLSHCHVIPCLLPVRVLRAP